MSPPRQNPYRSTQSVATPWEFIYAVEEHLGRRFDVDLAASGDNAKASRWISPAENTLAINWSCEFKGKRAWLNPEFDSIPTYAEKACVSRDVQIAMLVPASVSSDWFADYVHGYATSLFLRPRIVFVGHDDPFPKDLMLCLYGTELRRLEPLSRPWRWK